MEKKLYVSPATKTVILAYVSHLLQESERFTTASNSLSREQENRFEDTDEDWDWEDNSK